MRHHSFLLLAALALPASAAAAPTSAYTKVNLDRCRVIDRSEEGLSQSWRCPGYGGVPLYVQLSDERIDIDAGIVDRDELWSDTFDRDPETIEWRLDRGRPFAIIYRLTVANSDRPRTSRLIVETVGRAGKPGCRIADIPGATRNANAVARAAADRVLAGTARCLQP